MTSIEEFEQMVEDIEEFEATMDMIQAIKNDNIEDVLDEQIVDELRDAGYQ